MRIPIYSEDLLTRGGFKRIAKKLQRQWPGQSSIKLWFAREILSKGMGYRDYHDVLMSSKTCQLGAIAPTEGQVRAGIISAMSNALRSDNNITIELEELQHFVETLPLYSLLAFKDQSGARPFDNTLTTPLQLCSDDQKKIAAADQDAHQLRQAAPVTYIKKRKSVDAHVNMISQEAIQAIREILERSGSLRDQSLYVMMQTGLRSQVILSTKARFEPALNDRGIIQTLKAPVLISQGAEVIGRYIEAEKLKSDDYLFPSDSDPKRPMTSQELGKVFASWILKAQLAGGKFTPHNVRTFSIAHAINTSELSPSHAINTSELSLSTGHISRAMTQHYVTAGDTTPHKT